MKNTRHLPFYLLTAQLLVGKSFAGTLFLDGPTHLTVFPSTGSLFDFNLSSTGNIYMDFQTLENTTSFSSISLKANDAIKLGEVPQNYTGLPESSSSFQYDNSNAFFINGDVLLNTTGVNTFNNWSLSANGSIHFMNLSQLNTNSTDDAFISISSNNNLNLSTDQYHNSLLAFGQTSIETPVTIDEGNVFIGGGLTADGGTGPGTIQLGAGSSSSSISPGAGGILTTGTISINSSGNNDVIHVTPGNVIGSTGSIQLGTSASISGTVLVSGATIIPTNITIIPNGELQIRTVPLPPALFLLGSAVLFLTSIHSKSINSV